MTTPLPPSERVTDKLTDQRREAIAEVLRNQVNARIDTASHGAERIIASDPATPLLAECEKVLVEARKRMRHKCECIGVNPIDKWEAEGSICIAGCVCEIAKVDALLGRLREAGE